MTGVKADPGKPYKAVVAFVLSFAVALLASVQGRTDLDTLGVKGWLTVCVGALITAAVTYSVPNPITAPGVD